MIAVENSFFDFDTSSVFSPICGMLSFSANVRSSAGDFNGTMLSVDELRVGVDAPDVECEREPGAVTGGASPSMSPVSGSGRWVGADIARGEAS